MIEILSGKKVKELDKAFIDSLNITSWDLMEKASNTFVCWFKSTFHNFSNQIYIFCGPGNNGGDALAIARILETEGYQVKVVYIKESGFCSTDYQKNFAKLPKTIEKIHFDEFEISIAKDDIIIDGLFGVGLDRPLSDVYLKIIRYLNSCIAIKISIDLPSGIPADSGSIGEAFNADYTATFQFPKLSLLLPENAGYTGHIQVLNIGIPSSFLKPFGQEKYFIQKADILPLHKSFTDFSHKGDFGKILLIGGSKGKMGAILLSARAAMRAGSGLVFVFAPNEDRMILQVGVPEVMVVEEPHLHDLEKFDAIGIGPGWGMDHNIKLFESILELIKSPIVIDADGLNLLAEYPNLIEKVPLNSILTPHLKEFERLVGKCDNHIQRLEKAKMFAIKYEIFLVLKGAFTSISAPDGKQFFNSTGNKYMATAGSGDVLTGILTTFLGQGYAPLNAAICGVYQHGLAGELASKSKRRGMIASDIIEAFPETYLNLGIE